MTPGSAHAAPAEGVRSPDGRVPGLGGRQDPSSFRKPRRPAAPRAPDEEPAPVPSSDSADPARDPERHVDLHV